MDIKIEKKPWYIRYRYYMIAALAFIIFLIYVISLSLGPRKLRIETDNIQIAEVKDDKFMEYVDVEGLVQPILTIKVNTREAGSVDRIVGEEGNMMKQGGCVLSAGGLRMAFARRETLQIQLRRQTNVFVGRRGTVLCL